MVSKRVKFVTLLLILFLIIIQNFSYAGFFAVNEYVEINLKNYNNNLITIKNANGDILETNEKGEERINGTSYSGSLIISKGKKTVIDYLYNAAPGDDYISSFIIEITNNLGNVDVIKCGFKSHETKYYYLNYDCNTGKTIDISFGKENSRVLCFMVVLLVIVIITIVFIRMKRKLKK